MTAGPLQVVNNAGHFMPPHFSQGHRVNATTYIKVDMMMKPQIKDTYIYKECTSLIRTSMNLSSYSCVKMKLTEKFKEVPRDVHSLNRKLNLCFIDMVSHGQNGSNMIQL